jgi:DNA anti-recombination protein RmuC
LNKIIKRINTWDEPKFKEAFKAMNAEVIKLYGLSIPYSKEYFGKNANNDMVVLGESINKDKQFDNLRNELLDIIDQRFSEIKIYLDNFSKEMLELTNKRTLNAIKASKDVYDETLNKLDGMKIELETKFNNATKQFEDATKVISLGNKGIDANSIKELYLKTNSNNKLITDLNANLKTVKTNYSSLKEKYNTLSNKCNDIENNVERKVKDFTNVITKTTESKIEQAIAKVNEYSDKISFEVDDTFNITKD